MLSIRFSRWADSLFYNTYLPIFRKVFNEKTNRVPINSNYLSPANCTLGRLDRGSSPRDRTGFIPGLNMKIDANTGEIVK